MANRPNCMKCVYYYVTHDPAQPQGCRGLGFKSVQNPAAMVFASSGMECHLFTEKKIKNQNSGNNSSGGSRGGLVA
ncbi:MAG TPA: uracil-DNA glycosylase [Desulfocapsa sulfexigens]|nr:uracil-DNA glycosylase [Desulfocapsa sulfexigens]